MEPDKRLGLKAVCIICVITSSVLWASSGVVIYTINGYGYNANSIGFFKLVFCALGAFLFIMVTDRSSLRLDRRMLFVAILMGLINVTSTLSSVMSVFYIPTGLADVLQCLTPYFSMILAVLILRDKVTWKHVISACIGITGCALVDLNTSMGDTAFVGVLLSLVAAFLFGAANIGLKVMLKGGMTVMAIMFYTNLFSALMFLPWIDTDNIATTITSSPYSLLICMLICFGISLLPLVLNTFAMKGLDVSTVTIMGLLEVFFATIIGMMFLNESYDIGAAFGLMAILVSGILINYEFKRKDGPADGTD